MKKITIAALLSLAAVLGGTASQAKAFCFCRKCCYKFSICCKPYNAFTPVCYGKMFCDGCCPSCPQPCPQPCCPAPAACCCTAGGCGCDSGCLGELPSANLADGAHGLPPYQGSNGNSSGSPSFNAPMPTPIDNARPMPIDGTSMYQPRAYYPMGQMLQQAAYTPGYYPNYYGAGYYPNYYQGQGYYPAYYPNYYQGQGYYPAYYPNYYQGQGY